MKRISLALITVALIASSCTKETRPGPQAQVKFINASANTASAEITFDGMLLVGKTSFQEASPYAFVNVGAQVIKIEATANTGTTVLVNGNGNFQAYTNYTIVATDSTHKLKTSIILDDLPLTVAGKAYIRFLHLIGNGPSINVDTSRLTPLGGTLFLGRSFNDQATNSSSASFVTVDAGTYSFTAKNGANSLFTKSINLESGRIYTIAATGIIGATTIPQVPAFTVFPNN